MARSAASARRIDRPPDLPRTRSHPLHGSLSCVQKVVLAGAFVEEKGGHASLVVGVEHRLINRKSCPVRGTRNLNNQNRSKVGGLRFPRMSGRVCTHLDSVVGWKNPSRCSVRPTWCSVFFPPTWCSVLHFINNNNPPDVPFVFRPRGAPARGREFFFLFV